MSERANPPATDTLIDISVVVHSATPEWPGDTPFSCRWTWDMARGASVNVSAIETSPHVGTHADAPFHVDQDWPPSEYLALDAFDGAASVVDVSRLDGPLTLESLGPGRPQRLLLRTGRSIAGGAFPDAWPWLAADTVQALLAGGLRLLGVDAPSVDGRDSRTLDVHKALFRGGAAILENLDLRDVSPGDYTLTAFPQRIAGLDAAPVRAVLRRRTPA